MAEPCFSLLNLHAFISVAASPDLSLYDSGTAKGGITLRNSAHTSAELCEKQKLGFRKAFR